MQLNKYFSIKYKYGYIKPSSENRYLEDKEYLKYQTPFHVFLNTLLGPQPCYEAFKM